MADSRITAGYIKHKSDKRIYFFGLSEILNFAKIQLKFNYWTRFARFYVFLGKYC